MSQRWAPTRQTRGLRVTQYGVAGDKQRKEGAVLANGCVWRDPHVAPINNHLNIRIMNTLSLDCRSQHMMERIIADRQTLYSHVEFVSWVGNILTLAVIA